MISPSQARAGAIAAVSVLSLAGCTSATTLGVSPTDILSAVIANIPSSTTTTSSGGRTIPTGGGSRRRIPESPPPSTAASRILRTADAYVGVPYVWGGNTPKGFDCSGFTKYVFAKSGITLPRTSREQVRAGSAVAADFRALRPGDLMMFAEPGEAISHVAIYVGNGRIIHASVSGGGVGYTDLNSGGDWFVAYFVAARRVL
jgi:cell wall-associated NlpC family hydrolase